MKMYDIETMLKGAVGRAGDWRWLAHVAVVVLEVVLAVSIMRYCFTFRPSFPVQTGVPWWSQFPWQAIVTLIGGVGALVTFFLNRRQQRIHFDRRNFRTSSQISSTALRISIAR